MVVGVDGYHLSQLSLVWSTWKRHKPDLLNHPMIVFFDRDQVMPSQVRDIVDHSNLKLVAWPDADWVSYPGDPSDKWTNPQRYRMLSGFVHVPATHVETRYWLKIDTDVVASGKADWIDPLWFRDEPAIVAHKWAFTKPADQMLKLDAWVDRFAGHLPALTEKPPLNMIPKPDSDRIGHKRVISWCGFFHFDLTTLASRWAEQTVGHGLLPVPSQDGYMFYLAKRLGLEVKRVDMKRAGFEHWHTMGNVIQAAERAMKC